MADEKHEQTYQSQNNLVTLSFLQLRLDCAKLIRSIEEFISNKRTYQVLDPATGNIMERTESIGEPLANIIGITAICNITNNIINTQVVQGNFTEDRYIYYVARVRREITNEIVLNCYDWGISDSKLNYIIDNIMRIVEPFISRLIGNKERESYMQQFVSKEIIGLDKRNPISQVMGGVGNS